MGEVTEEKNNNHAIDFRVIAGGDVVTTFKQLKNFQNLGLTGSLSNITFNDITLPAGVFEDIAQYLSVYDAIANKNTQGAINAIPETVQPSDYISLLQDISRELQRRGAEPIAKEQMDSLVSERYAAFTATQEQEKTM